MLFIIFIIIIITSFIYFLNGGKMGERNTLSECPHEFRIVRQLDLHAGIKPVLVGGAPALDPLVQRVFVLDGLTTVLRQVTCYHDTYST